MMWEASAGMGWWMLFGSIAWLVFMGVIVFGFMQVFSGDQHRHEPVPGPGAEPPIEIARRRYAAGEISEDQFRKIREQLGQ